MLVGNINFVCIEVLSDVYTNAVTLMARTVEYCEENFIVPVTLERQYGNGEEFDLTVDEIEEGIKRYDCEEVYKIAEYLYAEMLERRQLSDIVIVSYDTLRNIEIAVKNNS